MKIKALVSAVALAFVASTAYADTVLVNPDGPGGDATIAVGSLDWATGNAQLRGIQTNPDGSPVVGSTFQVYAHSYLQGFQAPNGKGIGGTGLNSAYEWTFVAGFTEMVTGYSATTGQATFAIVPGAPENFFRIYYDASPDSDPLSGLGFDDGTLILSGNATTGNSTFSRDNPTGGPYAPLDQFTADGNNYPGIQSVTGTGGTRLDGVVTFTDPSFFLTPPAIISLNFQSQQNLPYQQTDPSALFYNLANAVGQTAPTVPGATVANVGAINGASAAECLAVGITATCGTGNVLFQTDASTAFVTARVPEPGSLALVALATGLAGFVVRRRKKS